ncbi:hypothetical protein Msp_0948 [Methanosphaera stadtmanae DSM 3091]|uniref:Uncharacterized protein n=1 Tax=Methanosphaera stadtmanae (strain ATCC 43021 / DSM 3091 / JCM 11832 / MCB-3) TaxID=339860 RepID=Q2NFR7_METST|nr:hypothetical protein Msp_0948 [Methanosphaera stadtmanae DSM 3091]
MSYLKFQFHYDLILLIYSVNTFLWSLPFQFHYDLILFCNLSCICIHLCRISISL